MLRSSVAAVLLPCLLAAQGPGCHDLNSVAAIGEDFLAAYPVIGDSCIQVDQRGQTLHQSVHGAFTLAEVVAIASATKTLSAAVLLSLVDSGTLSLDDRVGQYLPEYNSGPLAAITLRMCFAHTSGMPANDPAINDNTTTLRAAAQHLATLPLQAAPGTTFEYGGVSMHIAGAVCEVAAGMPWAQLFQQRIAGPLQMTATDYYAFGPTLNPRIAGGARSNLRDYAAFVDMLRARGSWHGVQVLQPASVDVMLSDQTSGLPVLNTPHPEGAPYGIGIWLDRRDGQGQTVQASAGGAFGFAAWVDRAHDASGVFLTLNRYPLVYPYLQQIWQVCDDALLPAGVQCVGGGSPACDDGMRCNANRAARTGEAEFQIVGSRGPANALGGVLLGGVSSIPAPLFDLDLWIGLPAPVFSIVVGDADGRMVLPAPLSLVPAGTVLGAQWLALDSGGCGSVGLRASHALQLSILP
ncbi:MAG: beta-lactamase family protein [Planctomycetes bacterium]|jgi:CubicO group peptidase (beta-lactamase class C family)|nr:beta-lactamase family protein [Planctomycetota bacterium]